MKLILDKDSVRVAPESLGVLVGLATSDFAFLRENYPSFDSWLQQKVLPGITLGERTVLLEMREGRLIGLAILKHSRTESKLCTLRVRPEFECRGLGVRLFESAFEILETTRPLLSVSDLSLPKFSRLFDHFGFACEAAYQGLYTPRITEFAFNGLLVDDRQANVPESCAVAAAPPVALEKRLQRSGLAELTTA